MNQAQTWAQNGADKPEPFVSAPLVAGWNDIKIFRDGPAALGTDERALLSPQLLQAYFVNVKEVLEKIKRDPQLFPKVFPTGVTF